MKVLVCCLVVLVLGVVSVQANNPSRVPLSSGSCNVSASVWIEYVTANTDATGGSYFIAPDGKTTTVITQPIIGNSWWTLADVSLSGSSISMSFVDNSTVVTGSLSSDCDTITWQSSTPTPGSTTWRRRSHVTKVHIVSMNHLDVAYSLPQLPGAVVPEDQAYIINMLHRYFYIYFPRAMAVSNALRDLGYTERFVYTTHPWLLSMMLDCPANYTMTGITLKCPTQDERQAVIDAIHRGDIVFHAGPFNSEYEGAVDRHGIAAQFALAKNLAKLVGVDPPTVVSLRDVPGTTRALIPLMVENGIRAISIGVNDGSPAPELLDGAVLNPGVWKDPATNTSVMYMQTSQGQGYPNNPGPDPINPQGMGRKFCVQHPNLSEVLCWLFRTDNSGPPLSVTEVISAFDIARYQFPGAQVVASTYEKFVDALETVHDDLVVATGEVGDNWETSTTAAPWKMAWKRMATREYGKCVEAKQCDPDDKRIQDFTRQLIKIAEHTYGWAGVNDKVNYTNVDFHAAYNEPAIQATLASYTEQQTVCFLGVEALGSHPLRAVLEAEWAAMQAKKPDTSALKPVPKSEWATTTVTQNGVKIGFDGTHGALSTAIFGDLNMVPVGRPGLALLEYQSFNTTVYSKSPTCCWSDGERQLFTHAQATNVTGTMTSLYANDVTLVATIQFPELQHEQYGAAGTATINATVDPSGTVFLDVQLFNVTKSRLGGAHMLHFNSTQLDGYTWEMNKLESWLSPREVVYKGSQHQHGINRGMRYTNKTVAFFVTPLDADVVAISTEATPAQIFQYPLEPIGPVVGFASQLQQNAFATNTPLWAFDSDYRYRYKLSVGSPDSPPDMSWPW